jgi:methylated-DNA-[protein]-cysteine S-methyltransferase
MIDPDRKMVYTHRYCSPVGDLYIAVARSGSVLRISFTEFSGWPAGFTVSENKYACGEVEFQLDQYFHGQIREFSLPIQLAGTSFQKTVWSRLSKIDYGTTLSYGEIARRIGRRDAARAVGNAVAANPIAIVVPCHRVLKASGGVGSYALRSMPAEHGRSIKERLLRIEGALPESHISL